MEKTTFKEKREEAEKHYKRILEKFHVGDKRADDFMAGYKDGLGTAFAWLLELRQEIEQRRERCERIQQDDSARYGLRSAAADPDAAFAELLEMLPTKDGV